jgi:hypothetical protein
MIKTKKLIRGVEDSFKLIKKRYGKSNYYKHTPKLHFIKSKNILKQEFADGPLKQKDIKDMEGWFDPETNTIVLVVDNIDSKTDFVKTLLHEYRHYLQSPKWMTRYYKMGHTYKTHPYELASKRAEKQHKRFIIK